MNCLFRNESILVAGAAGLLGSSLVAALIKQGARVIAADLELRQMHSRFASLHVRASSDKLILCELDITKENQVREFFEQGSMSIDGVVNSTYPRNCSYGAHFFDVDVDSFNENVSLHLGSAFLLMQQCASYFLRRRQPFSLVNMSSIYGLVAPRFRIYENTKMTMPVEYAAVKSAIQHLTKYVVAYVNDSRFRVNCVCPGGISDDQSDQFMQAYKEMTLGEGMLNVADVVGAVMFLLSNQSRYVTGQNVVIDDGFTL